MVPMAKPSRILGGVGKKQKTSHGGARLGRNDERKHIRASGQAEKIINDY